MSVSKVRLTVTESRCRCDSCRQGDVYLVEGPPICHELWNVMYPSVYALLNGGTLDCGDTRAKSFDALCPDGGRVRVHGEAVE